MEKIFRNLWNGNITLWKTFWVFGACVFTINLIFSSIASALDVFEGGFWSLFLMIVIHIYMFFFLCVSIWRSANKYAGRPVWKNLAKIGVFIIILSPFIEMAYFYTKIQLDENMNASNITNHLVSDEAYPYIGLWKVNCSDGFGLAIDKANDGLYSISFCGPGGCFKPGSYRPNTNLVDDDNYRIIDLDEIEVKGRDGYDRYIMCN